MVNKIKLRNKCFSILFFYFIQMKGWKENQNQLLGIPCIGSNNNSIFFFSTLGDNAQWWYYDLFANRIYNKKRRKREIKNKMLHLIEEEINGVVWCGCNRLQMIASNMILAVIFSWERKIPNNVFLTARIQKLNKKTQQHHRERGK